MLLRSVSSAIEFLHAAYNTANPKFGQERFDSMSDEQSSVQEYEEKKLLCERGWIMLSHEGIRFMLSLLSFKTGCPFLWLIIVCDGLDTELFILPV